jgi:hypothetical protein
MPQAEARLPVAQGLVQSQVYGMSIEKAQVAFALFDAECSSWRIPVIAPFFWCRA